MPKKKKTGSRSFGAFNGVFVPTFLSIIGVILFLRLGFIVGVAGVMGAAAIILLAVSVTLATGLSVSSITTNIRIGAGGAYSIISKTLGLEVGGSIGIPLFLAQTFSVALYVFGFAEAWGFFFPAHNKIFIAVLAFLIIFLLNFLSTRLAVKAQLAVMAIVCIALISVALGGNPAQRTLSVPLIGSFQEMPFWGVFALFFPAVTGLMAGIGLSGELTDPKRQISRGVISALGVTTLIYLGMVLWFGHSATPAELIKDSLFIVRSAAFPKTVAAGILAATFSSALTTMVAAPRVLQALGNNSILPMSRFLSAKTKKGEPKNAILITGLIVVNLLVYGTLNSVAQILTMFFLITYAMINISVFLEQNLGLVSFRPTFKIPKFVPLYGAIGSIVMMFLISVVAGLAAIVFIFFTYFLLVEKNLQTKEGDIRSGLFRAFSEWAAKTVKDLPESTKHIWKPNILLPVVTTNTLFGNFPVIKAIAFPNGTMTVLGFKLVKDRENPEEKISKKQMREELKQLPHLVKKFGETGIFTSFSTVEVENYSRGLIVSLEAIESQVFPPNVLFLPFAPGRLNYKDLQNLVESADKSNAGIAMFHRDPEVGIGAEEDIHIWLSPDLIEEDFYAERDFDLGMLIAYRLYRNWVGKITLWMPVKEKNRKKAENFLEKLVYEARFPASTEKRVITKDFTKALKDAPQGDIHIIPFQSSEVKKILKLAKVKGKSFLFVLDSGKEDVLA